MGPSGTITAVAVELPNTRLVRVRGGEYNAISHTKKSSSQARGSERRGERSHTRGGAHGALVAVGQFGRVGGWSVTERANGARSGAVGRSASENKKRQALYFTLAVFRQNSLSALRAVVSVFGGWVVLPQSATVFLLPIQQV